MSVIAPIAACNLSATSAFYRAESFNVGFASSIFLALSTMRSIPVTFANAGTLKKIHTILSGLFGSNSDDPANGKSVNCSLRQINATNPTITITSPAVVALALHGFSAGQEVVFTTTGALPTGISANTTYYVIAAGLTAGTFEISATAGGTAINATGSQSGTHTLRSTIGSTQTKTAAQITDSIPAYSPTTQATPTADNWVLSFEGTYGAVTTAASTYTIDFWQTGAQAVSWSIGTSDGTNPCYIAFCDNAVTAVTGSDFIAFDYPVYVDENFTLAGVAGTGNATVYGAWIVKGGSITDPYSTCNLRWQIPALAAYTLTANGNIVCGAHAGIYVGLPITFTGALAAGATSATLSSNWTGTSGTYPVIFNHTPLFVLANPTLGETEYRMAVFTNGSPGITFSALTAASTTAANIGVSNANMGSITMGSGFNIVGASNTNNSCKSNCFIYAEYPAVEYTTLNTWTPTISIASPGVVSLTAHGFAADQQFTFTTSGTLPTGITAGSTYFVLATGLTANTFQFSTSSGGAAIITTGTQSGTHRLSTAVTGQKNLVTSVSTGWPIGAVLGIGGGFMNPAVTTLDTTTYTITAVSGQNITVGTNIFQYNRVGAGGIFRLDGYGFQLTSAGSAAAFSNSGGFSGIQITGCRLNKFNFAQGGGVAINFSISALCAGESSSLRTGFYFNHVSCQLGTGTSAAVLNPAGAGLSTGGMLHNNVNCLNSSLYGTVTQTNIFPGFAGIAVKNCYVGMSNANTSTVTSHSNQPFTVNGLTVENCLPTLAFLMVQTAGASLSNINLRFGNTNVSGSGAFGLGIGAGAISIANTANINIDSFGTGFLVAGNNSAVDMAGVTFGAIKANINDLGTELTKGSGSSASIFADITLESPTNISTYLSTYFNMLLSGSALKIFNRINPCTITIASPGVVTLTAHGYSNNQPVVFATTGALPTGITAGTTYYTSSVTTNTFQISATPGGSAINTSGSQSGSHTATSSADDFAYTNNGIVYRDNATFRNGPSAIKINTFYTTLNAYTFSFPAASGVTYAIPLNMQYDTNYNSGLTIQPKVVATQGQNTLATVTSTAAALNAWERQTMNVSQSTGLTQTITLTFYCQSSNSGGNAWIDGLASLPFVTSTRFYGYQENLTSLTKTVDSFNVLSETAALALSGISYSTSTNTVSVTGTVSLSNIYDFVKATLAAAANQNIANSITTGDGVNFVGTFNLSLGASSSITGTGSLNIGANTLTVTAGAASTAVIKSSAQTFTPISITNIVAGSVVQVYNTTTSTEIYKGTPGTSLATNAIWTTNQSLRIRVRNASGLTAYAMYETTASLVQNGVGLAVSQVLDAVYNANAIDGSSVTEFSLSGSTIKIYVSDSDNNTTAQRFYNWYVNALSTSTYIGLQPNDVTALSSFSYVLADAIQFYNQKSATLFISGANINNVSGNGQVIDNTGGPINISGYFPFSSASDVGLATWGTQLEGTYTAQQIMRGLAAVLMGKVSGGPGSPVFRDMNDTTNRVTGTADSSGNRSAASYSL